MRPKRAAKAKNIADLEVPEFNRPVTQPPTPETNTDEAVEAAVRRMIEAAYT